MSDSGDFDDATDALFPVEDELLAEAIRLNNAANTAVIAAAEELVAIHPPLVDTEMIDAANTAAAPPPAVVNRMSEPPTNTSSLEPHMYYFLKVFDGTLRSRGSHLAKLDERVDKTIAKILQLDKPSEQKMELVREKSTVNLVSMRRRRTFREENRADDEFKDGTIIVVTFPIPEDTKEAVSTALHLCLRPHLSLSSSTYTVAFSTQQALFKLTIPSRPSTAAKSSISRPTSTHVATPATTPTSSPAPSPSTTSPPSSTPARCSTAAPTATAAASTTTATSTKVPSASPSATARAP